MANEQVFLGAVFTNTGTNPVVLGDLLIRDLAFDNGVERTTAIASPLVVGVALGAADPGSQVSVATIMGQRVTMRILNGSAVVRGDRLVSDSVEGLVRVDNAAPLGQVIAVATKAKGAGAGTAVEGILVAGGSGGGGTTQTFAQTYAQGSGGSDQTALLLDAKGGGLVIDATNGGFTGATSFKVTSSAGDFAVDRATGFVGINKTVPAAELHLAGATPALRFEEDPGGTPQTVEIENTGTVLKFQDITGVAELGRFDISTGAFHATGGLVAGSAAIAGAATTLTLPDGAGAAVGAVNTGRLRYNDTTGTLQVSLDGAAYVDLATGTAAIGGTIANNQIAVGSGANTIDGSANLTWDDTTVVLRTPAATTGGLTVRGLATDSKSVVLVQDSSAAESVSLGVGGSTFGGTVLGFPLAGQVDLRATPDVTSAFTVYTTNTTPIVFGVNSAATFRLDTDNSARVLQGKLQLENGNAAAVSAAATGAFRYNTTSNKVQVSQNGGAWTDLENIAGGGAATLAVTYANGAVPTDQTLVLKDADGGVFSIDATDGGYTGLLAWEVNTAGGDFVVDRAAGFVGLNVTSPTANLHLVQGVATTGTPVAVRIVGGAHSGISNAAVHHDVIYDLARTVTLAAPSGSIAEVSAVKMTAPTYAWASGSNSIAIAAILELKGQPVAGAGMTLSQTQSLWLSNLGEGRGMLLSGNTPAATGATYGDIVWEAQHNSDGLPAHLAGKIYATHTDYIGAFAGAALVADGATDLWLTVGGDITTPLIALSAGLTQTDKHLQHQSALTKVSATLPTWNAFMVVNTLTLTGSTALGSLHSTLFAQPILSVDTGGTVTAANTVTIAGPPSEIGPGTLTNGYSLRVELGSNWFTTTKTVASAAGAVWDGILVDGGLNLTGVVTVTEVAKVRMPTGTIAGDTATVTITDAATLQIDQAPSAGTNVVLTNSWALRVKAGATEIGGALAHTGLNLGFYGTAAITQPSVVALTNNVAVGTSTADTLDNWTDLATYATDAAAIRNAVHQLGRKVDHILDGLHPSAGVGLFST